MKDLCVIEPHRLLGLGVELNGIGEVLGHENVLFVSRPSHGRAFGTTQFFHFGLIGGPKDIAPALHSCNVIGEEWIGTFA